jgi:hypothetical protein
MKFITLIAEFALNQALGQIVSIAALRKHFGLPKSGLRLMLLYTDNFTFMVLMVTTNLKCDGM